MHRCNLSWQLLYMLSFELAIILKWSLNLFLPMNIHFNDTFDVNSINTLLSTSTSDTS